MPFEKELCLYFLSNPHSFNISISDATQKKIICVCSLGKRLNSSLFTIQHTTPYRTTHCSVRASILIAIKFYVRRVRVAAIFDYFSIIFSKYSCVFTSDQLPVIIEKETVQYVKTQTCTA
jgi:hypothetical protein